MPTYTYRCDNDDCPNSTAFEVQHSMTETCEGDYCDGGIDFTGWECTGSLKRVYTPPGISFKGDGWGHLR